MVPNYKDGALRQRGKGKILYPQTAVSASAATYYNYQNGGGTGRKNRRGY
jgi:hypothetical protein